MRVIGTAGHVDHGKSTLVQALSGINPDRLQEEQARGMTIDLGFAWIDLPVLPDSSTETQNRQTQSVGIVDVPGHIDFIKNMLAGVGSIDAAVLVIAADEGVMPQTREHLAILDLLAVPAGVVALTKVDLIDDPEWLDLIELDVVELLQDTGLADAPIIRLSAVSGDGLDELRQAMAETLAKLAARRNRARPRLPIDRIFSLSGFGTVVTGTLSDGFFKVGDPVEVMPSGREARIRGLQTHKKQIWEGRPGSRLAMNISGIRTDEIRRGEVVIKPGTLRSTMLIDVAFRLLPDAAKPLVHNQAVDFFSGASEIPARVRLLGTEALEPGEEGWLQLRLERPAVVTASDRYILRLPSPSTTLGGGLVLSPHPRRRWRRFDAEAITRLKTLSKGAPDEILLQALSRHLYLSPADLAEQSGLDLEIAQNTIEELRSVAAIKELQVGNGTLLFTIDTWQSLLQAMDALLGEFHIEKPTRLGMPRGELRSRLETNMGRRGTAANLNVRVFNALVEAAEKAEQVESDDNIIWKANFEVTLTLHQKQMIDHVLNTFEADPFAPPNMIDTVRMLDEDEGLLDYLVESAQLVRLAGGVLFRTVDYQSAVENVKCFASQNGSITLAQARDLLQTSRKYVQAILEEMDTQRITRRDGDARVLRGG